MPPRDDDDPAADWAPDAAPTEIDRAGFVEAIEEAAAELPDADTGAVPVPIADHVTANNPVSDLLDQARAKGYDAGAGAVVEQVGQARAELFDVFRALWVIFELGPNGPPAPDWDEAKAWAERRLTPV